MVKGVTRPADERMSPQAKVVFGIVIVLSLAILVVAAFGSRTSGAARSALKRQDCRSLFAAPITDANTKNQAADNEVRKGQVLAQYYGATREKELFDAAVDLGFKGLKDQHVAQFYTHWYNDQYQILIRAQKSNHALFSNMCKAGPKSAPAPPPYKAPPR